MNLTWESMVLTQIEKNRVLPLIEQFLLPIFSKTDFWGFLKFPPLKKILDKNEKENYSHNCIDLG